MQKLTRTLAMASAIAFMGVLAGCGDDVVVEPNPSITLTPPTASLRVGESVTFSAAVAGVGSNRTVTWTTSDQAKVTVDNAGKATAVAPGTATITASAGTGNSAVTASAQVTVSGKGVQSVTVNPSNAIIKVGEFIQAGATVARDAGVAGTVTWSSSATSVATVDATGKVTAVANGSATITAASTVDPTVTGSMALTVRPIQPAQISVQKVTTANTNTPVNPNNVQGQVDVTLNLDPGDQTVSRVEVLLVSGTTEIVACSQNLSVADSEQLRMAAAFEEIEAVDILCSINTAEFNPTNGTVKYGNGTYQLRARATVAGGTGNVASPSVPLIFNNQSGFIAGVANTNTVGGPASAINPINGLKFVQGNVTLTLTAVNYTGGGATVSQVSGQFLGRNFTATNPTGQVFTVSFPNSGATATNIVGYQTPLGSSQSIPVVTGSTLSTGNTGPTTVINVGATAAAAGLQPLDSTRVDNVAPVAPTVGSMPIWLNGAFNFDSTSTAVSVVNDAGVDNVTFEVYYIAGALPTASACDLTGMTKVTSGSALPETIVSSAYRGRVVIKDALGNTRCADLAPGGIAGGQFGADRTAPSDPTFAGPGNDTTFIATGAADAATFAFSNLQDNASGFGTYPVLATLRRFNAAGTTTCLIGTSATTCATKGDTSASFSATRNTGIEGYYLFSGQVQDSALNANATIFNRRFLVDATPAAVTGILSMPSLIAGQGTSVFNGVVTDNIDLAQYYGLLTYGANPVIRSASTALGTYGEDVLTKSANVSLTLNGTMRCLATTAAGVPQAPVKLSAIDLRVQDFAQMTDDVSSGIGGGAQAIPAAAVENCAAIANVNTWVDSLPAAAVNISKAGTTASTATTVNLMARALVPLNVTSNPFQRVEFYRVNAGGELVLIGTGTAALTQTPTERIWTYSFTWDPPASLANGAVTIRAIGVTSTGDGVLTAGQSNITIVP